MNNIAVQCADINKSFGQTPAIQNVSLALEEGKFLALLGPSGCGKTTLLRLIAGFEMPDKGTIEIGGRTVSGPGVFVPPESRQVGIVFQDYALFP
ncbi:MAG: ATP-binding cassette domain-containing protein, partial [Acidobacteria bacterium]|nr:ATP-binding cassette domain-containing protein [Acidobacteriota bacterium]